MAIKNVEVSQDVGNARAVALLHALRDPSFADHLAPGESERLGGYGGKYHHELGQADAVWMVNWWRWSRRARARCCRTTG